MAKLFSLKSGSLPSKGVAGDCYFTTDTKQVFIAVADGALLNLADLLSGAVPHVRQVGPVGERGPAGINSQVPGLKGDRGSAGRDGKTGPQGSAGRDGVGRDGQTGKPGRDGKDGRNGVDGKPGKDGAPGKDGNVCYVGPAEIEAACVAIRAEKAKAIAILETRIKAMGNHGVYAVARLHLEAVRKELVK